MKSYKALIIGLVALALPAPAAASDFFSTDAPDRMMDVGVRIGVNTSNVTLKDKVFPTFNSNSWGTGFDAGVVADLNIRDYISIQPGFFFQSRSGNYFYGAPAFGQEGSAETDDVYQIGHLRSYRFNIPVLVSLHFNITNRLRWNVDFGPYLSVNLHSNEGNDIKYAHYDPIDGMPIIEPLRLSTVEGGMKFGSSLRILDHYVVGVHYLAGMSHAWKHSFAGGRNKTWSFTIGYDF